MGLDLKDSLFGKIFQTIFDWLVPDIEEQTPDFDSSFEQQKATRGQYLYGEFTKVTGKRVRSFAVNENKKDDIPNETLYAQIHLSMGEIQALDQVYVADEPIADTDYEIKHWSSLDGSDLVVTGYTVVNGQAVTTDHTFKGYGNAFVVVRIVLTDDSPKDYPKLSFSGRGRKVIKLQDNDNFGYSNNTADVIYDFLTASDAGNLPLHRLLKQSFITEGGWCNTIVYENEDETTQTTISKLDIRLDGNKKASNNLQRLIKNARAWFSYRHDGMYQLAIERDKDPVNFKITNDMIMGAVTINPCPYNEFYDQVVIEYRPSNEQGEKATISYPEDISGIKHVPKIKKITVEGLNNGYHAKQYAYIAYWRSREKQTQVVPLKKDANVLNVGDVVKDDYSQFGIVDKPYLVIAKTVSPNEIVTLELLEYQEYIYPWVQYPAIPVPDSSVPDYKSVPTPSNLTISSPDDGINQLKFNWDSELNSFEVYLNTDYITSTANTFIMLNGLDAGDYNLSVIAINGLGYRSEVATLPITLATPDQPVIDITADAISATIKATLNQINFNSTFEARIGISDVFGDATDLGQGNNWTVNGLNPDTTYYVWARTINVAGESGWTFATVNTLESAPNIINAIDGHLNLSNLSQDAQDTLDQLQVDIATNTDSNEATKNALEITNNNFYESQSQLMSTLAAVGESITADVDIQEALLGYYAQVEMVEKQVVINTSNIEQSATKIELQTVQADLKGDIDSAVFGDYDALRLGEVEGRIDKTEFFIGQDNLDGQATISSVVNEIIFDKDFATATYVGQEITALGIEQYATLSYVNGEIGKIEGATEILSNDAFYRSIVSFAVQLDTNQTIGQQLLSTEAQMILNQVEGEEFKGSLAATDKKIEVYTDETTAEVESLESQLARVDDRISLTQEGVKNVVNETSILAEKTVALEAANNEVLAEAQEYTAARVGYCVDENGVITNATDAVGCLLTEGNQWQQLPLATALEKVQVTVTNPDGSTSTASAVEFFQALTTEDGELKARAAIGVETGTDGVERFTGIVITDTSKSPDDEGYQTLGAVDILANNFRLVGKKSDGTLFTVMDYNTSNNTMNFPAGSLTLSQDQTQDLSPAGDWSQVWTNFNGEYSNGRYDDYWNIAMRYFKPDGVAGRYPVIGDRFTVSNGSSGSPKIMTRYYTDGDPKWSDPVVIVDGDLVAKGTIAADKMATNVLKVGSSGGVTIDNDAIDAPMLIADAISGKKGVFGSGDYVVRLNENSDFPIWFGGKNATVNHANAKWFLDKNGEYKRDISAIADYYDNNGSWSTNPKSIIPNESHYAQKGTAEIYLKVSGIAKRQSLPNTGSGYVKVTISRAPVTNQNAWVVVGTGTGNVSYTAYAPDANYSVEIDTTDSGMTAYTRYVFKVEFQLVSNNNVNFASGGTINGKFRTFEIAE